MTGYFGSLCWGLPMSTQRGKEPGLSTCATQRGPARKGGRIGTVKGPIQAGKEPGCPGAPRAQRLCWASQGTGSCWLQFGHETVGPEPWTRTSPLFPQAQIIAQAIGQAFGVAYQRFLEANSIDPSELSPRQYSRALEDQEQYNAELTHFSRQENCKDVRAALEGWGQCEVPAGTSVSPLQLPEQGAPYKTGPHPSWL